MRLRTLLVVGVVGNLIFWGGLLYGAYVFARFQGWVR